MEAANYFRHFLIHIIFFCLSTIQRSNGVNVDAAARFSSNYCSCWFCCVFPSIFCGTKAGNHRRERETGMRPKKVFNSRADLVGDCFQFTKKLGNGETRNNHETSDKFALITRWKTPKQRTLLRHTHPPPHLDCHKTLRHHFDGNRRETQHLHCKTNDSREKCVRKRGKADFLSLSPQHLEIQFPPLWMRIIYSNLLTWWCDVFSLALSKINCALAYMRARV